MAKSRGRHLRPGTRTRNQLLGRWNRTVAIAALALFVLMIASVGAAAAEHSVQLAGGDRNTASNSIEPGLAFCPRVWAPSDGAVVWKLTVDPGDNDDWFRITDVKYQMSDQSAVVGHLVFGRSIYIRTNDHVTLVDAKANIRFSDDDKEDKGEELAPALRLAGVCYRGGGPVPNVAIVFQSDVCDSFASISGNQVDEESGGWDQTSGMWEEWGQIYKGNAPQVQLMRSPSSGCSWHNGQRFAVGTSSSMANRWVVPGATGWHGNGTLRTSSRYFPAAIQRALAAADGEVWFSRIGSGGVALGAFKCHDDSLHADGIEFIHETPSSGATIVCVSHSVRRS